MDYTYRLPCSSELTCEDRLSILDSDELQVPTWKFLKTILRQTVQSFKDLRELLDSIHVSLDHGNSPCADYRGLEQAISTFPEILDELGISSTRRSFFEYAWPSIVAVSLELDTLFPSGSLAVLTPANAVVSFSRRQIACLVVHQFLGTLPLQPWASAGVTGAVDFRPWYPEAQVAPSVVQAYLSSLLAYFARITTSDEYMSSNEAVHGPITFTLKSGQLPLNTRVAFVPLGNLHVVEDFTTEEWVLGLPDGAAVVFANKNVGFGVSGTQEETCVGSAPEACVASLLAPTLKDDQVMIIRGAAPMTVIQGYGRTAHVQKLLAMPSSPEDNPFADRVMLFMDALELDHFDPDEGMPDLLPGHVQRELRKAYVAFSSGPYKFVMTGLWGCGAFCGDEEIKSIIQWCAASLAGVTLQFVVPTEKAAFAQKYQALANNLEARNSIFEVIEVLMSLRAETYADISPRGTFNYILEQLQCE
jgi:poly(ADP-ribose) glycohydrolase